MIIYVNPLNQRIIWQERRMGYEGISSMDKLDKELRFKKTEDSIEGSPDDLFLKVTSETKFKKDQWVKIMVDDNFTTTELWKIAMKKYKEKI